MTVADDVGNDYKYGMEYSHVDNHYNLHAGNGSVRPLQRPLLYYIQRLPFGTVLSYLRLRRLVAGLRKRIL